MILSYKNAINKKYIKVLWGIIVACSFITFVVGNKGVMFNSCLIGIVLIWFGGILYSIGQMKERIFLLFFLLAQFVFLIVKPLICMCRGEVWWTLWEDSELFAVRGLYISLMGLLIGGVLASILIFNIGKKSRGACNKIEKSVRNYEHRYIKYLQIISAALFMIAWSVNFYIGVQKVLEMQGKDYLKYYASFSLNLPYVLIIIGAMMKYFLCIYLATRPRKKVSIVVLFLYLISTLPDLIIGIRNPFVLACIFCFLYFCIRDILEDTEVWFGKIEKILTVIMIPIATVLLGAYTYIRNGAEVAVKGFGNIILDFFYNQGSSFDVLAIGHGAIQYLPQRSGRNYTFGGIIDYVMHGVIGQRIFGTVEFPDGNCMINALERNSFAHNMSYIAKGKEAYLAGEGLGSSYILETYTDYGYIGILIFAIVLGFLLVYATKLMKANVFAFTVVLVALTRVFFVPRAESTGWIEFVVYIQFWIPMFACFIGAVILNKIGSSFLKKMK